VFADDELLSISTAMTGSTSLLVLRGELTGETSEALQRAVHDALQAGAERVEADLAGVVFIDSGGLSSLVQVRNRLQVPEVPLVVMSPSPAVLRVLESTQLVGVFHIADRT
jgi:anti-anti-sigma factor